jgi:hypothetical protein
MLGDAYVEPDKRDDRPVALPFRPDPRTIWAYESQPDVMRVRNQDGTEVDIPCSLFQRVYSRC